MASFQIQTSQWLKSYQYLIGLFIEYITRNYRDKFYMALQKRICILCGVEAICSGNGGQQSKDEFHAMNNL